MTPRMLRPTLPGAPAAFTAPTSISRWLLPPTAAPTSPSARGRRGCTSAGGWASASPCGRLRSSRCPSRTVLCPASTASCSGTTLPAAAPLCKCCKAPRPANPLPRPSPAPRWSMTSASPRSPARRARPPSPPPTSPTPAPTKPSAASCGTASPASPWTSWAGRRWRKPKRRRLSATAYWPATAAAISASGP